MNVILIVSDTFRRDYLRCYGNDWIHTENLDGLADESVIFDRAYAASFPTVPARHDIVTGRFTFNYSKWGPLPRDEVVLAQLLRQAGYATMLIADTQNMLNNGCNYDRGYDAWWWIRGQECDRYMTSPRQIEISCDGKKLMTGATGRWTVQYGRNISLRRFESDYVVAQTMSAACKWLELNYDQHENFFLYIDTFDPHEPWDPPKWYVEMYDPGYKGEEVIRPWYGPPDFLTEEEFNHVKALYAGEATLVDRSIGKVLNKVEDLGLSDDTAIIFTTDHGIGFGEHGIIGKHILMPSIACWTPLYEEIAHIPLIMRIPGFDEIKRCKKFVQLPDLMPTILELAGARMPETVQGRSLIPLLKEENDGWREIAITSPSLIQPPLEGQRITLTTDEWSFIYPGQVEDALKDNPGRKRSFRKVEDAGGRLVNELYHLPGDPTQKMNLYEEKKDVAKELHSKIVKFLEEIGTKEEYLKYWRELK